VSAGSVVVSFRCAPEQAAALRQRAADRGQTVAAMVLERCGGGTACGWSDAGPGPDGATEDYACEAAAVGEYAMTLTLPEAHGGRTGRRSSSRRPGAAAL
jgi:hypothetical protein